MAPVKERMKKSREKMKNDPDKWQKHLEKERSRDKIRRAEHKKIMKNSLYEMVENRKRVRDRVRAFRLRKQMAAECNVEPAESPSPIGSYKCVQSFGKAVNRTKRTLPESPHKKTAVLKKLVQDIIGPEVFVQISPRKKPSTQITDEVKNTVIEFFCQDDISRQTPGIKDCVIVRKKGEGKIKYQKRYMVMTIGEAYQEFKKSHPDINIGKSTFFSLRPPYIIRVGDTPHDVCICKYHFNVINLVECIGKVIPTFPQCHKELLQNISCNVAQESCMFGDCKTCSNCKLDRVGLDSALLGRTITWKQWEDVAGRPILKQYSGSCDSAIKVLEQKLAHFKIHTYVKRVQSDYCKQLKEKIKPKEAVLQFDFAENYALISQDEVQSAHWNHSQVTVFTCCIWLEQKSVKSYAVISNDRSHSKYSVWTFLRSVIQDIKRSHEIEHLYIFTDNCAGQFKSKYTLSNLCFFLDDFGTSAEWNFFASSHGKGAMDGIGGVVKRHVWTAVKSRRVLISNAAEFYDYTKNSLINVKCLYVDKSEIDSNVPFLDKRWESTMAIPKIQSCHHFQAYDKEDILVARTSTSLMLRTSVFKNNEEEQDETPLNVRKRLKFHDVYSSSEDSDPDEVLSAPLPSQMQDCRPTKIEKLDVKSGSFFLVKVASDVKKGAPSSIEYKYIAVCQNELDEEGDVKVMFLRSVSQKKNVFKADDDDVAFVKLEQLVCKLPDPYVKPQGNRLYFQFQSAVGVVEK